MDRVAATDPDATFTPNALTAHLRKLSGGALPIGSKTILRAIRRGELKASRAGSWNRIRWADFLEYLETTRVRPTPSGADRADARLRRETK